MPGRDPAAGNGKQAANFLLRLGGRGRGEKQRPLLVLKNGKELSAGEGKQAFAGGHRGGDDGERVFRLGKAAEGERFVLRFGVAQAGEQKRAVFQPVLIEVRFEPVEQCGRFRLLQGL